MERSKRLCRCERGQTTAFVLSLLFVLVLFVGMVADVGQAVNRRIALQLVADAGAWTGASSMAEGLNYMAYANSWIQDLWAAFTLSLVPAYAAGAQCSNLQSMARWYNTAQTPFEIAYKLLNVVYANSPYMEASRVSHYNLEDLFPKEPKKRFSFKENDLSPEAGVILPFKRDLINLMESKMVPDGTRPETNVPYLAGSRQRWVLPCLYKKVPAVTVLNLRVWYQKKSRNAKYFVWRVRAPATRALAFDSLFGPNTIPEMKAVAVARPVGGELKKGRSRYVAEMVPAARVMSLPEGLIYDRLYKLKFRKVTH